ncbi:hypothetical protein Tco_0038749 [Tanacetum coccineum]
MDSEKYLEGQSMQRPPLFESDSFIYWKNRFETYVKSEDLDLWHVVTNGDFQPIQKNPETKLDEVIPFEKQSNNQVKDNKIYILVQQYEQIVLSEDESIDSDFARFNTIITSLKALDEAIEESKDLTSLSLDELIGNLKVHFFFLIYGYKFSGNFSAKEAYFNHVTNSDMLLIVYPSEKHNLGGRHIQAYAIKASFQRSYLNKGQGADHKKVANSSRPNSGDSGSSNSYVNAIIFRGKVYWIRAKEVPGWTPDLVEDSDEEELSDDDFRDKKSVNDFEEKKLNEDDGDSKNSNLKKCIDLMIIEVYALYVPRDKCLLWDYLADVINQFGLKIPKVKSFYYCKYKKELKKLDASYRQRYIYEVEAEKRMEVLAALRNIDHIHSMDLAQKAKIKWSIEGDENSNFFHGILNKKRNQMNIRDRFAKPSERRANIDMRFPKTISEDQSQDLEREVSKQEIKTAVWGCGTDKSSGPDGFSFGFYRHFWPVIKHDVYMPVNHFFILEKFLLVVTHHL